MKKSNIIKNGKGEIRISEKDYRKVVNRIFEEIASALVNGEEVKIREFGTFKLVQYKERNGRNPKTGEQLRIPGKKVIKLNIAKKLKEQIQD